MAKNVITISNIAELRTQTARVALREINKIIKGKLKADLQKKIVKLIVRRFKILSVTKGLTGFYAGDEERDYQALFGLTDALAAEVVTDIVRILEKYVTVELKIQESKNKSTYLLEIKYPNLNNYFIDMASGSYSYDYKIVRFKGRKRELDTKVLTIPWMEWFITGVNVRADVNFDISSGDEAVSRSGRAVMRRSKSEDKHWDWDGIDLATRILGGPKIRERILQLVDETISKAITDNVGKL